MTSFNNTRRVSVIEVLSLQAADLPKDDPIMLAIPCPGNRARARIVRFADADSGDYAGLIVFTVWTEMGLSRVDILWMVAEPSYGGAIINVFGKSSASALKKPTDVRIWVASTTQSPCTNAMVEVGGEQRALLESLGFSPSRMVCEPSRKLTVDKAAELSPAQAWALAHEATRLSPMVYSPPPIEWPRPSPLATVENARELLTCTRAGCELQKTFAC